jgi:prepilin-type N-terminal cleavage/methylation domain-containing protein
MFITYSRYPLKELIMTSARFASLKSHLALIFAGKKYLGGVTRRGFTLVELSVVIVIIGVLAAFGVPRFLKAVEKSKAAEAFAYLSAIRDAQERYQAAQGTYATDLTALDIQMPAPKYFSVGTVGPGAGTQQNSWSLTLTRSGSSAGYGAYTVVFTDQGYDGSSTILAEVSPLGS